MPFTTTATWPALANRTASAADVNSKFNWLEGNRLPMNSGALTTGAYDIGSVLYKWNIFNVNSLIINSFTISTAEFSGKFIKVAGNISHTPTSMTVNWTYGVSSIVDLGLSIAIYPNTPITSGNFASIGMHNGVENIYTSLYRNADYILQAASDASGNQTTTSFNFMVMR